MGLERQMRIGEERNNDIEALFDLLELPSKVNLDVYTEVLRRWLLKAPHNINMGAYEVMANRIGIEPDAIKRKIKTLDRAGFIDVDHWTIYPCLKLRTKVTRRQLVTALLKYQAKINITKRKRTTIKDPNILWNLMEKICPKTDEYMDLELCKMQRWDECTKCELYRKAIKKCKNEKSEYKKK